MIRCVARLWDETLLQSISSFSLIRLSIMWLISISFLNVIMFPVQPSLSIMCVWSFQGPEVDKGGATAFQRGSRDAERFAAPQHRALLRLLGVGAAREEMHRPSHRAHDLRNT